MPTLVAAKAAGAPTINDGVFINTIINFLIIAFVVFVMLRQVARMTAKPAAPPAPTTTKECRYCASAIPLKATRCPQCTSDLVKA